MIYRDYAFSLFVTLAPWLGAGCAGSDAEPKAETTTADASEALLPPSSAAKMSGWLDSFQSNGWEDAWVCEAEATQKSDGAASIHVHGTSNRVCNNPLLAEAVLGPRDELPVGSAALKFVDAGIYVEVKTQATSDGGEGWFWYSPDGSVAEAGAAACVGCHSAAGSDADHPGLGDYVYFQVTASL